MGKKSCVFHSNFYIIYNVVTCNQSEKSDVMMDKSKYFYEFVKLRVVNIKRLVEVSYLATLLTTCVTMAACYHVRLDLWHDV